MVRSNYDTLTLKLQDGLDQFERYSEQPKEATFFKELVRKTGCCMAAKQTLRYSNRLNPAFAAEDRLSAVGDALQIISMLLFAILKKEIFFLFWMLWPYILKSGCFVPQSLLFTIKVFVQRKELRKCFLH